MVPEQVLQAIDGLEMPLLIFPQGDKDEVLLCCKELMKTHRAECIVVGNEADIAERCYHLKINEGHFYGILNPDRYPEREQLLSEMMAEFPEEDRKSISKRLRDPLVFSERLVKSGLADKIIVL